MPEGTELEVENARLSSRNVEFVDFVYERLQRKGYLRRDVQRMVNQDRNVFSACMVATGEADGMVTGVTRHFDNALRDVRLVIDPLPGERVMAMSIVLAQGHTLFIADTDVEEFPSPEALADFASETAAAARRLNFTPRVAFLSYSNFGQPPGDRMQKVREAVAILDARGVDFEYEGELTADVALDPLSRQLYPFSRLSAPANVLIMPAAHSASISTKLLGSVGGATVIGPVLMGLARPVQICRLGATVSDIVTMAAMAAHGVSGAETAAKTNA